MKAIQVPGRVGIVPVAPPPPPPPPPSDQDLWFGIGLDQNFRTVWPAGTGKVANNDSELFTYMGELKAGTLDEIWLIPGQTYNYPARRMSNSPAINRSATNPGRIRKDPAFPAGPMPKLNNVLEDSLTGRPSGIAFIGLDLTQGSNDAARFILPGSGGTATPSAQNILFEDCICRPSGDGGRNTSSPGGFDVAKPILNFALRFCKCLDNALPTGAGNQGEHGVFTVNVELKMKYCVVDHNGWMPGATRATPDDAGGANRFEHNVYNNKPGPPAIIKNCVIGAASSHGGHFRCGGTIVDNLFLNNPMSQIGYGGDANKAIYGTTGGVYQGNITIGAEDVNTAHQWWMGSWLWLQQVDGLLIDSNICTINNSTQPIYPGNRAGIWIDQGFDPLNVTVSNNVIYNFTTAARCLYNPNNRNLAGITLSGNHFEDGSAYADPEIAVNYQHHLIMPGYRTNGINPTTFQTTLDTIRAGFVIP